MVLLTIFIHFS